MNDIESSISQLSSEERVRPSGLISLFKRAPNSLRWRIRIGGRKLKREAAGLIHRVQGRKIVHLFHLGKTGGTAIRAALAGHEKAGAYELILHTHGLVLDQIPTAEHFAFVLRDPATRFVSGFNSRRRQEKPRHDGPWSAEEEQAFSRFETPNQLALALSSDDPETRAFAAKAIHNIRHIEWPQWKWFKSVDYLLKRRSKILFIGFQETLDDDFALFRRILNLPEGIELPRDDVAAHRNPAHLDKRLDPEAIRNLKIWFRKDFEFVELCKQIAAEIRAQYDSTPSLPTDLAQTAGGQGNSRSSGTALL